MVLDSLVLEPELAEPFSSRVSSAVKGIHVVGDAMMSRKFREDSLTWEVVEEVVDTHPRVPILHLVLTLPQADLEVDTQ